jgi:hypothetical protein
MTSGQDGPVLAVWPRGDAYYIGSVLYARIYIRQQTLCVRVPRNASAKEIGHWHLLGTHCRAAAVRVVVVVQGQQ